MKYQLIGLYELFTGIFGVIMVLLHAGKAAEDNSAIFTLVVGVMLYFGLALAGYMLMKKEKEAVKFSVWAQVLQIVGITYKGTQYLFSASAFLCILVQNGVRFHFEDKLINYNFSLVSQYFPFELRIFILPLLFLVLLVINKGK